MNALDALFRDEVDRQAGPLRDGLRRCRASPPDGETMFCAQALKGAARVVGMVIAEQLADALELLLGSGEAASRVLTPDQVLAAEEALEVIEAVAQAGADHTDDVTSTVQVQAIVARLSIPAKRESSRVRTSSVRLAVPAATLELFAAECEQQAAALSQGLLSLESHPDQTDLIEPLMRAAHSVKGAARVVGFDATVAMTHAMEDQLERARTNPRLLGPDMIDALLSACDLIKRIATTVTKSTSGTAPLDSTLLETAERITQLGATGAATAEAVLSGTGPAFESISASKKSAHTPGSALDVSQAGVSSTDSKREVVRVDDERVLRVRAGQISRLVGLAGESLVESDRLRDLAPQLTSIRWDQAALADLLDALDQRLGSPPQHSAAGQGLRALRLKLQDLRQSSVDWFDAFAGHARRSEQLSSRLFREATETRMRPLGDGLASFPRLVRDLCRRLDKQADLTIEGEGIRIDRDILERIEAPLNHLMRNALDHGVEPPELRLAHNKNERATISLRARVVAGFLQLEVIDDGAGIDRERVRTRIVEQNLAGGENVGSMDDERLFDFLFRSGFSTAQQVTELSGRGVGLAVVRTVMRDIGGAVSVRSQRGQGTCFTLRMPISRSVLRAVVVSICQAPYAFGLSSIARIVRTQREAIRSVEGHPYIAMGEKTVTLIDTATVLGLESKPGTSEWLDIVVIAARPHDLGFVVDAVLGQNDLVLHALDTRLGRIPGVSAAAILPDGQPVVVLDADDLCRSVLAKRADDGGALPLLGAPELPRQRRILVVDDSLTVRETERDALARVGYDITTAGDGMEAWQLLRRGGFDLVVTDVDMPRLDGLSLARSIRQDRELQSLPVLMVSYRGSDADRSTGLDAGADIYLSKAEFDNQKLCEAVMKLIGGPARR